jgi:type I restriction enzyme R subunit
MSNFEFLRTEWPDVHEAAAKAEAAVHPDPRTACFYARRALELAVHWAFKYDPALKVPYQNNLSSLVHEPTFKKAVGEAVFTKARIIIKLGNDAVHNNRPVRQYDALSAVRELFHVAYWLAHTYARGERPAAGLAFDPAALPKSPPDPRHTAQQLQTLHAQLSEKDENLATLLADRGALDEELKALRAEVAAARQAAAVRPDAHDYSEAETRDYFIDLLLREAGWPLDQARDREYPVTGLPEGEGRVDYVLWGDDGKPLALVEAKRARRDPRAGQRQAKLYADSLEREFGQRPVIFVSNGYDHWLWDDVLYPPRAVQGFYKKDELALMIQRRTSRKPLGDAAIDPVIAGRYYQTRAIRRVAEAFERDHERRVLLVMATGAGKTRTVIALCDLLTRCNWAKRVLFLADRKALVRQAVNAFKKHLPDASPVNLVTERDKEGRVFVSTYPTMMGLIDEAKDGQRRFGPGHFDLVVIDEAHRSVFQKYRAVIEYFDGLLVGLTATPKDEVDRNTYGLFELENGVPTDAYSLDEAVNDGYLVPAKAVSVPLRFQREGIRYDELTDEDREQWDALEWDDEGDVPDRVEADAVNKWLFNADTVDKVLTHLVTRGVHVAGGDRLGKTIIFAKNQAHANFIAERFDAANPHLKGTFAQVITSQQEDRAEGLIEDFSIPERAPHIAISVDMLDTGVDIPEVVNLVFFKLVRSHTKFWQMVGRGTRLSPDLFGPGRDKEFFYLFDYCQNLEFFNENPQTTEGAAGEALGKRLFKARLELAADLDVRLTAGAAGAGVSEPATGAGEPRTEAELHRALTEGLHRQVAAMNPDNFVVRPRRALVEKWARPEAWANLSDERVAELAEGVAGLPSALPAEPEEAKRFDLLILRLQLAVLRADAGFERLRDQLVTIAGLLEEKGAIPSVREQMQLIHEVQTDAWWQDVTLPMLERVRRRLRDLVRLIEKHRRKPVYTDFEDEMGAEAHVELPGLGAGRDFERFRQKARVFLRGHEDHLTIRKLRMDHPLTPSDLTELERMLVEAGVGSQEELRRATDESQGLGLFIRSLVGLDREAAKQALGGFMDGKALSANQVEFLNLVADHLTQQGFMPLERLYGSPFTDVDPLGVDGVFPQGQADELIQVLEGVRLRAVA